MSSTKITILILVAIYLILRFFIPKGNKVASVYLRYIILACAATLTLTPFFWLLCSVFKDKSVLMQYMFMPPLSEWSFKTLNLSNFKELFAPKESLQGMIYFWQYIANSLFQAATMTAVSIFFCSLGGYALAMFEFKGKKIVMLYMLITFMIPGMLLLAPQFRLIHTLGLMDTFYALIVPGMAGAFGMFLLKQAMERIPYSLIEAARIDGCSEFEIYYKIVIPLVKPMVSAFCLITFLGEWNSFLGPQIYLYSQTNLTLPVVLNQYIGLYQQNYGVFLAGTFLAILPPAILFFVLQKEFIEGLTSGAVKG